MNYISFFLSFLLLLLFLRVRVNYYLMLGELLGLMIRDERRQDRTSSFHHHNIFLNSLV